MPNGIVIIDKPQGWTSMDVCAKLRGILHEKRVGHAGTLDPMATGVLPVFVGQATKAVSFAEGGQKIYEAVLQLGLVTDTQDTTGETLEERAVTVTEDEVRAALPRFLGEIEQIPPMYSAIKVNGQKLYDLARQGREVARKPRMITIFDLALTQNLGNGQYALRIVCSKGTYIRTLCHDLGQALGCGGCMAALRRTEASNFRIDEAVTLEDVQREGEALLRPTDSLFRRYPAYTIPSAEQERKCLCGNSLRAKLPDGLYRVYGRDGAFLALSEAKAGTLTSKRNFFSV